MILTSAPIISKPSDQAKRRTVSNRNEFLVNMIKITSGESYEAFATQTSSIIKSLGIEER